MRFLLLKALFLYKFPLEFTAGAKHYFFPRTGPYAREIWHNSISFFGQRMNYWTVCFLKIKDIHSEARTGLKWGGGMLLNQNILLVQGCSARMTAF